MSRSSRVWPVLAAGLACALVAGGCTIETQDEASSTTLAPGETLPDQTSTTTPGDVPPGESPPGLSDASVYLEEIVRYDQVNVIRTRGASESIFLGDPDGYIYEIKRDSRRDSRTGWISYTLRPQQSSFLNISGQVDRDGNDYGFHGFAFSSDGSRLYVSFTNHDGNVQVDEFRVSGSRVSTTSQRTLLTVEMTSDSQHAGPLAMGPDGFLYIPLGDGGVSASAQDPTDPRGSILRIDPEPGGGVDPDTGEVFNYVIPLGNPYAGGQGGAREVYMTGLYHPQEVSFDTSSRDLWVADMGPNIQELTYIHWRGQPAPGGNLGWPIMLGSEQLEGDKPPEGHVAPLFEYPNGEGRCQVVGGPVYRGTEIPGLQGAYLYGDRCSGRLFALLVDDGEIVDGRDLETGVAANTLSAIGADPDGEVFVATVDGIVYRLRYAAPPEGEG